MMEHEYTHQYVLSNDPDTTVNKAVQQHHGDGWDVFNINIFPALREEGFAVVIIFRRKKQEEDIVF